MQIKLKFRLIFGSENYSPLVTLLSLEKKKNNQQAIHVAWTSFFSQNNKSLWNGPAPDSHRSPVFHGA